MTPDWLEPVVLNGPLLTLSPLAATDAREIAEVLSDRGDEVFQHLPYDPPVTVEAAERYVTARTGTAGQLPFAQRSNATGELVGSTSFYDVDPGLRTLAIGHTWIGRKHWRTGVNTASKLIMLSRAFDELDAERVVWHTDILNTRSQAAIERLGAQREGVLRHHRIRKDGSWRDTVQYSMLSGEWPATRTRLEAALDRQNSRTDGEGKI